ncbi:TRAP transporter small permease [Pigmentiphaga litoralis]|uniref:TRAP transporter small permease n=1 Tax=Pigmentiphaga litoralis TaxID=516702 RepID=UPI003899D870
MNKATASPFGLLERLDRCYGRMLDGLAFLACLLIASMVIVICADVVMRGLRRGNLSWAPEVAEYALYLATFLAAPWLLRLGQHIRMDIVLRAVPPRVAWSLELAMDVVGASICAVLAVGTARVALASAEQGSLVLKILVLPEWGILVPACVLFFILFVEFLFRLRRLWRGPKTVRQEATSAA